MSVPAPVAYAPSWTGCYIGGGGGGYGLWNQENTGFIDGPPRVQFTSTTTAGGRGYLGTVGGGCDYQFGFAGLNLVVGAFGDYDWSSIKGRLESACCHRLGRRREDEFGLGGGRPGRLGGLPQPSNLFHRWLHPSDLRPYQPRLPSEELFCPRISRRAPSSTREPIRAGFSAPVTNMRLTSCPACSGRPNTVSRSLT